MRVELVYDRVCPNVDTARQMIVAALRELGAPLACNEWERDGDDTPAPLRGLGSPTVLANRQDLSGDDNAAADSDANSCRVYRDERGCVCGAPSARMIVVAILEANAREI